MLTDNERLSEDLEQKQGVIGNFLERGKLLTPCGALYLFGTMEVAVTLNIEDKQLLRALILNPCRVGSKLQTLCLWMSALQLMW